ncbi:MAG TPA: hypothetical protein VKR21_02500 [Solirubrobacteraceae bacterium]|nr:hypothetical protein [Solirubrobacteraceae bacterium]
MTVKRWVNRQRVVAVASAFAAMAAVAAVAAAASSPSVTTGAARLITQTHASLHGSVNPNGSSTTYYFQWGLTTSYGVSHSAYPAGSGTSGLAVAQTARHLTPGTTYHYRLVATNQFGTTVGADRTFRTAGTPPPGVSTGNAIDLNTKGADLTGTVNPAGQTTTWYFQWGANTQYGQLTSPQTLGPSASAANVLASLQGLLAPGTVYHYRLVAAHSGARPIYGQDATFMTYPSHRPQPLVLASTRPRHAHHRPYTFTTSGRIVAPASIPAPWACRGNVTIRWFRGSRQVGFTLAAVQPTCAFGAQTQFRRFRHHSGPVHLRVVIRFVSTPYLATNRAPYEHVTAG